MTSVPSSRDGEPLSRDSEPLSAQSSAGVRYRAFKRFLDVSLATVGVVVTSPILLIAYVAVVVTSKGPGLFRQTRVGEGGRSFVMLKFRTMRTGADESVHRNYVENLLRGEVEAVDGLYKLDHDPRITRVGSVLRKLSIDELPQLFNVISGAMSLVGPRPAMPYEAEMFPEWASPRFGVPPGVTGLWQVSGRNELTMLDGLALDLEYVEKRSTSLDLRILLRTVPALLRGGAR